MNFFLHFIVFILLSVIGYAQPIAHLNIPYLSPSALEFDKERNILDIYVPSSLPQKKEVIIFVHGGKWKVGNKKTFRFIAKKFALHGIIGVVINYRLYPKVPTYQAMAMDCANAVKWVYNHIEEYGGDKNRIYLYGHSAGGHLSALITSNNLFFDSLGMTNPVKGCVLLDPFGLNIENYLQSPPKKDQWMYSIFTKNPTLWKQASPVNFVNENTPDFLLLVGNKSKNKIKKDGKIFYEAISKKKKKSRLVMLRGIGHLSIIFQLKYTKHPLFREFIKFMNP
ncbi:MAG TPA: alpha/beta hydrolase [Cytophagaceae bacterium]|jgi:acetyl esterase/lipase|nr:alpha/beta hydrolase [Cytophagaceae bacterium]